MRNKLKKFSKKELKEFRKELLSRFEYNQTTGNLVFRYSDRGIRKGEIAGHVSRLGYVQIGFKKSLWLAHQLIWLMVYGEVAEEIDHKNHHPTDNRLCNLRKCTHPNNNWNKPGRVDNTSGHRGVSFHKGKWRAYITANNSGQIHLGRFGTKQQAIAARKEAESKYFGEFKHGK